MFRTFEQNGHAAVVVMGDGRRFAGLASNFHPGGASLRLREVDRGGSMVEIHDLDMYEVHAIFFVRELALMRSHRRAEPVPAKIGAFIAWLLAHGIGGAPPGDGADG